MKYVCMVVLAGIVGVASVFNYSPVDIGLVQVETVQYTGTLNIVEVP